MGDQDGTVLSILQRVADSLPSVKSHTQQISIHSDKTMEGGALPWGQSSNCPAYMQAHGYAPGHEVQACGSVYGKIAHNKKRRREAKHGGELYQGGVVTAGYMPMQGGRGGPYNAKRSKGHHYAEGVPTGGNALYGRYKKGALKGASYGRVHYESRRAYGARLAAGQLSPGQALYRKAFLHVFPPGGRFPGGKLQQLTKMRAWGDFWNGLSPQQKQNFANTGQA
jgi:hypothetical protein